MIVSVVLQTRSEMTPNEEMIRLCQLRDESTATTRKVEERKVKERSREALMKAGTNT